MQESVDWVGIGDRGCHALDVKNSARLWRYYHERYCITLVTAGQAHWHYRNRYSEASVHGVMLMEPGEVHVNTSIEEAGSFFAVCISPEHVSELTQEYGIQGIHFNAQFLKASSCIRRLQYLKHSSKEQEPAAQEEQLCLALHEILAHASERPLLPPGRAMTQARRGAKLLRERYYADRWNTVDVREIAAESGMSYHWFVHSFKREFGMPPYRFVQALRCAFARSLIAKGPTESIRSMRDIAIAAGYADSPHMTREFRRTYGLAPGAMSRGMNARWPASPRRVPQGLAHAR